MSVSKAILNEAFSLGGELASDEIGARLDYAQAREPYGLLATLKPTFT